MAENFTASSQRVEPAQRRRYSGRPSSPHPRRRSRRIHHDDDEYEFLEYSTEVDLPPSPPPPPPPSTRRRRVEIPDPYEESPRRNEESPRIVPYLAPSTSSLGKRPSQEHLTPPAQVPNRANVLIVTDEVEEGALTRATSKRKVIDPCPNE